MNRKGSGRLTTIAIVAGCVLLSPLILAYSLIEDAVANHRRKRDANNFNCIRCGRVLGQAAIAQADKYWLDHVQELHKRFPHTKFRHVRNVWAICTECGAQYNYRNKDKTYVLLPETGPNLVGLGQ